VEKFEEGKRVRTGSSITLDERFFQQWGGLVPNSLAEVGTMVRSKKSDKGREGEKGLSGVEHRMLGEGGFTCQLSVGVARGISEAFDREKHGPAKHR